MLNQTVWQKFPLRTVLLWSCLMLFYYSYFVPHYATTISNPFPNSSNVSIQAIVYIVMGAMSDDPSVDYSIATLRKLGKWAGPIYVLTDNASCFSEAKNQYQIHTIEVETKASIVEIKALKAQLFQYLPTNIIHVLYLDVDILVTKNLEQFLFDFNQLVTYTQNVPIQPEFGAFLDAKGHFVGFCSGCDKWHTGVMYLRKPTDSLTCLRTWYNIVTSGRFNTDQQSLDLAEKIGNCSNGITFPTKHLLFAKDYIGMVLTSEQTFIHVTAAGRKEDQDYFYGNYIIPTIRNSFRPTLNPNILNHRKKCK